jgi:hypothetical protein
VRIKVLGLFPMTRRAYLRAQLFSLVLLVVMLVVGAVVMLLHRQLFPEFVPPPPPRAALWAWFWRQVGVAVFWVGLLGALFEGVETYTTLKKFARLEAATKAKGAAPTPVTDHPTTPQN